jgi:hypothetical protein
MDEIHRPALGSLKRTNYQLGLVRLLGKGATFN